MIATERFSSREISLDLSKEVTKKAVVRLDVQQHTVSFFTIFAWPKIQTHLLRSACYCVLGVALKLMLS